MYKSLAAIAAAAILSGCSTVQTQTVQYCDTTANKFIGIPYSSSSDCVSVGVAGTDSPVPGRPNP
jgi:hypothetical protein